jgi:hypothetical protein
MKDSCQIPDLFQAKRHDQSLSESAFFIERGCYNSAVPELTATTDHFPTIRGIR